MVKVQCIKCDREGSLTKKQTKSKGITYEYWYIEHHIGDKIKWCYLGKYEKLPEDYKRRIHKNTQTDTQNTSKSEKPKFTLPNQTKHDFMWAGSSAWHERLTCTNSILVDFEQWLMKSHTRRYSKDLVRYVRKYHDVLRCPRKISKISVLSKDTKRLAMSGLANLSKYLGCYEHWKTLVKNAGLKWEKKVSLDIVLDIINSDLQDCWVWLEEVLEKIPKEYGCVLVFTALTGLRPSEAAKSTKLISDLYDTGRLNDYLNQELLMLEHFRYSDLFLRRCKNAYISFITPELLELLTICKPRIKYSALDTKINRLGFSTKTKQL
jgi:hypothetical protein